MAARRKTTRREFLQGKAARDALEAALSGDEPGEGSVAEAVSPQTAVARPTYLLQIGRRAMACDFQVLLNAGQHRGAEETALAALDLIEQLEAQLTVYRSSSELCHINRMAAAQAVPVEPRLFGLLQEALTYFQQTGGAFDITSGPLSQVWGFSRRQGRLPTAEEINEARARVGSQWLELVAQNQAVRFQNPNLELNLGSIGKGYALDRCRELLAQRGVENFMIHGGHSSILAVGSRSGPSAETGWTVALRHPLRPQQRLGQLRLRDRTLGTSGSAHQFFYHQGQRFGHVLDPRTGWPAQALLSATILAPRASMSDALATACFVLGVEGTRSLCQQHPDLSAVLVLPGQRSGAAIVETIQMDPEDWTPASA